MMKEWILHVSKNEHISAGYFLMEIEIPPTFPTPFPGQFIHIKVGEVPSFLLRRPFSIFSYEEEKIGILYRVVGRGTKSLSLKKKGDRLNLLGPLGNSFLWDIKKLPILVGGGRGIAPLHFLLEEMRRKELKPFVFLGFKNGEEAILVKRLFAEYRENSEDSNFFISTEDGSEGEKGKITEIFEKYFPPSSNLTKIFACGPKGMLKEVGKICEREKVECEISMEQFMGCGIGVCQSCVVKTSQGYKKICKDGPVFNPSEIIWELT